MIVEDESCAIDIACWIYEVYSDLGYPEKQLKTVSKVLVELP